MKTTIAGIKKSVISLCVILLCGCGQSFRVGINCFSQPTAIADKTCIILSGLDKIPSSDLQFQEFQPYVQRALEHQGYRVTDDPQKARIEILVSYTISGPIQDGFAVNTIPQPTYAVYTPNTAAPYSRKAGWPMGSEVVYAVPVYPTYMYLKTVVLEAWDAGKGAKKPQGLQLWKMMITTSASSNDLRDAFPVMMAAAMDYIGRDTQKLVSVTIKENDDKVQYIKGLKTQTAP
jgi:hypothetical protein